MTLHDEASAYLAAVEQLRADDLEPTWVSEQAQLRRPADLCEFTVRPSSDEVEIELAAICSGYGVVP